MKSISLKILSALFLVFFTLPLLIVHASETTGGVNVFTILPELVCVGDTYAMEGAAGVTFGETEPTLPGEIPLPKLAPTNLVISAIHGKVTPQTIFREGDYYFTFTYTAMSPGDEVIKVVLNNGLAMYEQKFKVQKSCDYDVFTLTTMNLAVNGDNFRSITRVSGMGTMKRLRTGVAYFQGEGKWDLEEDILTAPSFCVKWNIPPLIANGPFDLDGKLDEEGESVDAILSFLPGSKPIYHGVSTCIDAEGNELQGWSLARGGNSDLASKVQSTFPPDGGTQEVELTGKGMDIVQSAAIVEYTSQLTLIPR
jgi:hypothetical protein